MLQLKRGDRNEGTSGSRGDLFGIGDTYESFRRMRDNPEFAEKVLSEVTKLETEEKLS
jgi:hypothetical protein